VKARIFRGRALLKRRFVSACPKAKTIRSSCRKGTSREGSPRKEIRQYRAPAGFGGSLVVGQRGDWTWIANTTMLLRVHSIPAMRHNRSWLRTTVQFDAVRNVWASDNRGLLCRETSTSTAMCLEE
jgi:hypothetical protein